MKVAVIGLGKMGSQIADRFASSANSVVGFDPHLSKIEELNGKNIVIATDKNDVINKFGSEKIILWLMIPAQFVEAEIKKWASLLPKNSIIIDGGNTDFRKTIQSAKYCKSKDIFLVDVGVSGGILGNENGFSMMVGGDYTAVKHIEPLLEAMSSPRGGYEYFGENGAGHYVKMVHNAIEYGMMQSLAEGYRMLKEGPYKNLDLAKAGRVWQKASVIESTLNNLSSEIMAEDSNLSDVDGYVAESGEAKWALEVAKESGIDLPVVAKSLQVRRESEQGNVNYATKLLAKLRTKFGGHSTNKNED